MNEYPKKNDKYHLEKEYFELERYEYGDNSKQYKDIFIFKSKA
jgi:hypothetical protein